MKGKEQQPNNLTLIAVAFVALIYVLLYMLLFVFLEYHLTWYKLGLALIILCALLFIFKGFLLEAKHKYFRILVYDFSQILISLVVSILVCTWLVKEITLFQDFFIFSLYALSIIILTIFLYSLIEIISIRFVKTYIEARTNFEKTTDFTQLGTVFASVLSIMYLGDISLTSQPITELSTTENAKNIANFMSGKFTIVALAYIYLIIHSIKKMKLPN